MPLLIRSSAIAASDNAGQKKQTKVATGRYGNCFFAVTQPKFILHELPTTGFIIGVNADLFSAPYVIFIIENRRMTW